MAAVTLLGTGTWTTANGTKTVTATPALGDVIVLVVAHTGNTASNAPTDNNTDGGGTYTLVNTAVKTASADTLQCWVRTAPIGSASSTVFTHAPGTTTGGGVAVMKITGMKRCGADAIRQSAVQNNQATATPTVTLGIAPLTGNALIGASFNSTGAMTPRSSPAWTERADLAYANPTSQLHVMSIDSGETATSIAWGSSTTTSGSLVLELDTSVPPTLNDSSPTEDAPIIEVEESAYETAPIAALLAIAATAGVMTLSVMYTTEAEPSEEPYAHVYVTTPYIDNDLAADGTLSITGDATLDGGAAAAIAPQSSFPTRLGPFLAPRRETGSQSVLVSSDVAASGTLSITGIASLLDGGAAPAQIPYAVTEEWPEPERSEPYAQVVVYAVQPPAAADLQAAGTLAITGVASLTATGTLAAPGTLSITGTAANLTALGTLAAPGTLSINGFANLTAAAANALQAGGSIAITGNAELDATGTLAAAAGSLSITGTALLSSTSPSPDIVAAGTLSMFGYASLGDGRLLTSSLSSQAPIRVGPFRPPRRGTGSTYVEPAIDLGAAGAFWITGDATLEGVVVTLTANGTLSITGDASLSSLTKLVSISPQRLGPFLPPQRSTGSSSLAAPSAVLQASGTLAITGAADLTAAAGFALIPYAVTEELPEVAPTETYIQVVVLAPAPDPGTIGANAGTLSITGSAALTSNVLLVGREAKRLGPFFLLFRRGTASQRIDRDAIAAAGSLSIIGSGANLGDAGTGVLVVDVDFGEEVEPPDTEPSFTAFVAPVSAVGTLTANGSIAITGNATARAPGTLTAAGTLSISGFANLTEAGTSQLQAVGTLSITGNATPSASGALAAPGTLSITGTAANLKGLGVLAVPGTLSITGTAANLRAPGTLTATGTLTISGAANLGAAGVLVGTLVITGNASLTATAQLAANTGSLAITGLAPLSGAGKLQGAGSLSITGTNAPLSAAGEVRADGTLAINGLAVPSARGVLAATTGTLWITGDASIIALGSSQLQANTGSLSITGNAFATSGLKDVAANGSLAITGNAALVAYGKLAAATGSLAISGTASTLNGAGELRALQGSIVISGAAQARGIGRLLASGTLVIDGFGGLSAGEIRYRAVVTARQRNRDARMGRESRLSRATERVRVLRAPPVVKN